MGRAKEWMMEMEQRGYGEVSEKMVCAELFRGHRMIVDYIAENGKKGECDYTHTQTEVVPLEDIVSMVVERFMDYYETPEEECAYESRSVDEDWKGSGMHSENGYIIPNNRTILTTLEALQDLGLDLDNEELEEDIAVCFNNDSWILKDPYGTTDDEELNMVWNRFFDSVCKKKQSEGRDDEIYAEHAQLLDDVVDAVLSNISDLVQPLPEGMPLFRCVYYNPKPEEVSASNIWAPPADKASSQRMSREGQSRFYASLDMRTPQEEATNSDKAAVGLLGRFLLKDRVKVLDLTNVPYRSFMDVHNYFAWCFLIQFADYIAQPVEENEKYKYAPTQILRDVFEKNIPGIQGIMYKSCKCEGKKNVVMFWDDRTCGDYIKMDNYKEITCPHVDYCYMCGKELSDDGHGETVKRHKEHIMHNGIYGRLKSSTILCEKCGGAYSKSDAKFVELFSGFIDLLQDKLYSKDHGGDKRKRLKAYLEPGSDRQVEVDYKDGKTSPRDPYWIVDDEKKELILCANDNRQKGYENVVLKEHPEYASYAIVRKDNITDGKQIGLFFSENNPEFNKIFKEGIAKIATEFAIDAGVDRKYLATTLKVQEDGSCVFDVSETPLVPYSPQSAAEMIVDAVEDVVDVNYPHHMLRLYVEETEMGRLLLCYVELFSTFKFYVVLNDQYEGKEISRDYAQRIVSYEDNEGEAVCPQFDLKDSLEEKCANILSVISNYCSKSTLPEYINEYYFETLVCNTIAEEGLEQLIKEIADYSNVGNYKKRIVYHYEDASPCIVSSFALSLKVVQTKLDQVRTYTTAKFNQLDRYCWNIDLLYKSKYRK